MGHRHFQSHSYLTEAEDDQNWNMTEHPYTDSARSSAAESSSFAYPADDMSIDGVQHASCNPAPVSGGYSSMAHNVENPHCEQDAAGTADSHLHSSSARTLYTVPEIDSNLASSSNYNEHSFHQDNLFEIRVANRRCPYKRKSPEIPAVCERDGRNGYNNDAGSSSEVSIPTDPWQETQVDVPGQTSHGPLMEWHPNHISSSAHDNSSLIHESDPFLIGSNSGTATMGQNSDLITSSQNIRGTSVQSVRSSYSQRSVPTFRVSSSSMQMGHAVASDDEMQLAPHNYCYPHPRPSSTIGWRSSEHNRRARMSSERYTTFSDDTNVLDQPAPEGLTIVDLSALYGSRNAVDQHHHMRLDIDDMSYEELLALGERIGSVNTGLSEDLISKSLTESIYCSLEQMQEEGNCAICLEEYANMDGVGTLKVCGHDFHVDCIKKWLSIKNVCPICKTEPSKQK